MRVIYRNDRLEEYLNNPKRLAKDFPPAVVKAVPKKLKALKEAESLRHLLLLTGGSKKLKGRRQHQHRLELDGQFRLILEVVNTKPLTVMIMAIGDIH